MERPVIFKIDSECNKQTNDSNYLKYCSLIHNWKRKILYSAYFGVSENEITEIDNIIAGTILPHSHVNYSNENVEERALQIFDQVENIAKTLNKHRKRSFINKVLNFNWFRIIVSLFLFGVLYISYSYVDAYKKNGDIGRYQTSYGGLSIDTKTGTTYYIKSIENIPE